MQPQELPYKATNLSLKTVTILFIAIQLFFLSYLPVFGQETYQGTTLNKLNLQNLEIPNATTSREEQVIRHKGYIVSYNKSWKLPNWVSYELTRTELTGKAKRNNRFMSDPFVYGSSASNKDYARSGFDKGHMAPAADMKWDEVAMKESFYFSNVCPQHPELNRRKWKDLESQIRDWARVDSVLIIICGPLVDKQSKTIGRNSITVPTGFFKIILSPFPTPRAIGFIFKNERSVANLRSYCITIDNIESISGLDFFSHLPNKLERQIESQIEFSHWPMN
ncbi:DNA/RNA non-specific endonuclease [Bacteroides ihuae]|uniref:DNA/RNA non-specific endonuclease n=1 Tax=Bacteroides ihuae TaxID=1852362 RepID=UPI0008DADC53|nr:DNA/RNA non-specific endonuclease [Bacteroides ihuae]